VRAIPDNGAFFIAVEYHERADNEAVAAPHGALRPLRSGGILRRPGIADSMAFMNSGGTISVILRNNNSTLATNEFEVFDNTWGRSVGTFTLKGGESRAIEISADDSGKGSVKIRNPDLGPNDWVQVDAISAGDVVTA
jgi:hypothetical protein